MLIAYNAPDANLLGVSARRFNVATGTLGPVLAVSSNNTNGSQTAPRVAFNEPGESIVTWVDDGTGFRQDVYARRYDAAGGAVGNPFPVDNAAGNQTLPEVALDDDGTATVAYHSTTPSTGNDVFLRRFGKAGWSSSPLQVNKFNNATSQADAAIAVRPGFQDFVVAWASNQEDNGAEIADGVYSRLYQFDGNLKAAANELLVNSDVQTGNQSNPSASAAANGTTYVVYQSARTIAGPATVYDVFVRALDVTGANSTVPQLVATSTSSNAKPVVAASNGSFVVAWSDVTGANTSVFARRYTTGPNLTWVASAPVLVNDNTATGLKYEVAIGMNASGRYAISWTNNYLSIGAKRFAADGTPVENEFVPTAPDAALDSFGEPAVAVLPNGDLVLGWYAYDAAGGTDYNVYARRYPAAVAPASAPPSFRLNDEVLNTQYGLKMAVLTTGDIALTWQSYFADGNGYNVRTRRLRPDDSLSAERRVNVYAPNDQYVGSVVAEAGGRYSIAWESGGQNGGVNAGVYFRRFDADDAPLGPEVRISNAATLLGNVRLVSAGGQVVAVYQNLVDASNYDIFFRRFTTSALVSGVKRDENGNPVEGVTVFLDANRDGSWQQGESVTVTDAAGTYEFRDVPGGTSDVVEIPIPGTAPSATAVRTVTLFDGEIRRPVDFANDTIVVLADRTAVEGETLTFTPTIVPVDFTWEYSWQVQRVLGPGNLGPILATATTATFDWIVPNDGIYKVILGLTGTSTVGGDPLSTAADASVFATNALPANPLPGSEFVSVNETEFATLFAGAVDVPADLADMTYEWTLTHGADAPVVSTGTGPTFASLTKTFGNDDPVPFVYTVRYHDDNDPTVWFTRTITVSVNDVPATASIDSILPANGSEGDTFAFNGSYVGDPNPVDAHALTWDILNDLNAVVAHGTGPSFSYAPSDNGTYTARLTVGNGPGADAVASQTFAAANVSPTIASFTGTASTSEETEAAWTVSFTDAGSADTHDVSWEIRDATNAIVATGNGMAVADQPFEFAWTPQFSGHYSVRATVTDDDSGATTPADLSLVVHNVRPRQVEAGPNQMRPKGRWSR